jgi:hypothetical protein
MAASTATFDFVAETSSLTHDDLVAAAAVWLRRSCPLVLTELATSGEEPDAIGWKGNRSTLVECKVSRADFLADRKKHFRFNPAQGIGRYRYFFTPPGLVAVEELPENWGLIEWNGKKFKVVRKSEFFDELNQGHEIDLLISLLRRIGQNPPSGVSVRVYTIPSKNRATLGIKPEGPPDAKAG